jgi:ferredoxin
MSAVTLTIDGVRVSVPEGSTLLDAAMAAGIRVPTLCLLRGFPHQTACGVCVVEAGAEGRLVPSCSCPAEEGLDVLTASADALGARKAAVDLLLSEHSGDCRAPCTRACPAGLDVMKSVGLLEAGDARGALELSLSTLPFPGLMAAACAGYCERVCRRAGLDAPIDIRGMHVAADRAAADRERAAMIGDTAPSGSPVVVRGAGPAALSAAFFLMRAGRPVTVIGDLPETLRRAPQYSQRAAAALEREIGILKLAGCGFLTAAGASAAAGSLLELDGTPEEWRIPAKAVSRGRLAAHALLGAIDTAGPRPFESIVVGITGDELRSLALGVARCGGRCLSCGCAREKDCSLRSTAHAVDAGRRRFPGRRIPVRRSRFPMGRSALVFEPGKCIRCGICVRLSARTAFPLAFMGRGFTVEVGGFDVYCRPECASDFRAIAAECPTGCLSWEEGNV